MTTRTTRAPGTGRPLQLRSILGSDWFAIAAACVLGLLIGTLVFDEPGRVDLEITNPTVFALSVEVTDTERDGWQPTADSVPARPAPSTTSSIRARCGSSGSAAKDASAASSKSPAMISKKPAGVSTSPPLSVIDLLPRAPHPPQPLLPQNNPERRSRV